MKSSFNSSVSGSSNNFPMNISRGAPFGFDAFNASSDASLFSSSLPVLSHERLNQTVGGNYYKAVDDIASALNKSNGDLENLLDDGDSHLIGSLLPDEEELFAGIMNDLDLSGVPKSNALEDMEEYDVFGSGGGLELETDTQDSLNKGFPRIGFPDTTFENSLPQYIFQNGAGTISGEHPYGEHPSRTLFVRNINSNVEDSELRDLFEQYGDIRTLYTACKHRGFVMISYYDIRAARAAMRALQNKPLRRRKLDIHFSIPKDNPSEKDINQGTLVVFNLEPSVSNEELEKIFGAYGEVKEIRETPNKRHHKFVEFFDVRSAEAALKGLNRSDIAGKRIKLEHSRPGGARRNSMLVNLELDQDDSCGYLHSPLTGLSPGNFLSSPAKHSPHQSISKSPIFGHLSPTTSRFSGLSALLQHSQGSNPSKAATMNNELGRRVGHLENLLSSSYNSGHGASAFPEMGLYRETATSSVGSSNLNMAHVEKLSGSQFLWGSPSSSANWPTSSSHGNLFSSNGKAPIFPYSTQHGSFHHHHVGSAPSGFFPKSPETSFMGPAPFGGTSGGVHINNSSTSVPRNARETGSPSFRMMSSPRHSHLLYMNNSSYPRVPATGAIDLEHGRGHRLETSTNQLDSKKQFQLDLGKIISGEDTRTTLMIKNIPNKYTSKMLLAAIDETNRGTYDFLYLPIDFKNKCNVGYAFINMISPKHIILLYEAFNGKKWEKFNSEKVASLAYARLQGKAALVAHFQNSSLMNEDKHFRPIVFDAPPQSSFPMFIEHSQPDGFNFLAAARKDASSENGQQR
ncbi:PREDICTED: protein MEI2-like 3 [Tarenaya hassleriana]|uniref:protein MEI2-like 3 n=1 Tax=Tarenaya hassleriana TaxID=28532 RepID=UPI00053C9021|nr:PREDICTED: protein MEI2-like 3 [Tarenaya hassleriana]XP_010559266.1 PREDICTED: protein MEI2-like 3 [Tarenaya hassleriana]XP_010559267.1 PREDICTED: protein MEI2-like 3 [Tarenaya hassleriana]